MKIPKVTKEKPYIEFTFSSNGKLTLDGNLVNVFNSIKDTATNNGFDKKWFSECRIIKKGLFKGFYWLTSKQAYAKGFKTNLSV